MPPVPLMVLDSLADDAETVYSMRNCGDMEPHSLALVGDDHLLPAVRALLADGLIEVESEYVVVDDLLLLRELDGPPSLSDQDLKRYWLVLTRAGHAHLAARRDQVEEYYEVHPVVASPRRPSSGH